MNTIKPYLKENKWLILAAISIKFISAIMNLIIPLLLSFIIDDVIHTGNITNIILLGILMIICSGLCLIGDICGNRMASKGARNITRSLRHDLFTKITYLSEKQVDELGIPSLVSRMTNDTYNVHNTIGMLQRMGVRAPILIIGGIVITMFLDPILSLILVAVFPLICLVVFFVTRKGLPLYGKVQLKVDKLTQRVRETTSGIRVIKALSKEEYQKDKLREANLDVVNHEKKASTTMAKSSPILNFILNVGLVLVIFVGAYRVDGGLSEPGKIIAFTTYFTLILNAMMAITRMFMMISKASASLGRITEVMNYPKDLENSYHSDNDSSYIIFENVNFSYNNIKKNIDNLSFKVAKGSSVGIIGATGTGKSTIINLLMRFYDPNSGAIYINGKNIKEYDEGALRNMFGTVSQQDALFSNTIGYNVDFNRNLDEESIMKAIKASQAYNFVFNEKEGLDTMLNARGTNLSGGQKQRLLIARALANNPEILVLDDSSSALDYKTDSLVRKSIIEEYHPTLFIISQRISSISNLDQIIVMDNGKAVAIGTHEHLLETCKIYQDIYKLEVGNHGIANA